MPNLPSGAGQTDKDHAQSTVTASDDPILAKLDTIAAGGTADDADIAASRVSLASVDTKLTSQATAAKQDTGNTSAASIDSKLDAVKSGLSEKDQLTSATPGAGGVFVIAAPATSTPIDLSGANYTALLAAIVAGKRLRMVADFDLWYRWGTGTGTVDETKTAADTPLNQAESLYASERVRRLAPTSATWLMVKGEVDTLLRITIAE